MVLWLLLSSFLLMLATGTAIGIALCLSSALVFVTVMDVPLIVIPQRMFTAVDSFSFLTIPFFMMAGAFMSAGGVTKRLVDFSLSLVGALTGGLALVVSVAAMFFAALSGSTAATTAAIGSTMIHEMERRGYAKDFSAAVVACSGIVGIVIPPSITLVVYGAVANTSIADLFMGGFAPGIMMGCSMMLVSWIISKKRGYKGTGTFEIKKVGKSFIECFWALLMPLIILGGIYGGIFTATEAAAVAAVYGIFVGMFIYKELKVSDFPAVLLSAATSTTMIMFVIGGASVFGWILANARVPQSLAVMFTAIADSPVMFLMLINILLLIVGCLVNASAAVVILTPIFLPILSSMGIDPVFFGVLMIVNLSIGAITPPVGVDLFVVSSITGLSIDKVVKQVLPYLGILLIDLIVLTFFPNIIQFLPRLMNT